MKEMRGETGSEKGKKGKAILVYVSLHARLPPCDLDEDRETERRPSSPLMGAVRLSLFTGLC